MFRSLRGEELHLPASSFVLIYCTRKGKEGQSTRRIKRKQKKEELLAFVRDRKKAVRCACRGISSAICRGGINCFHRCLCSLYACMIGACMQAKRKEEKVSCGVIWCLRNDEQ